MQVQYTAYGEVYLDSNPEFQLVVGFHGGLYDPLTKLVHFTQRDYDVLAGRWTSPDYSIWPKIGKDPSPFNLYMFKNNNPLSDMLDVKNYVTGRGLICVGVVLFCCMNISTYISHIIHIGRAFVQICLFPVCISNSLSLKDPVLINQNIQLKTHTVIVRQILFY